MCIVCACVAARAVQGQRPRDAWLRPSRRRALAQPSAVRAHSVCSSRSSCTRRTPVRDGSTSAWCATPLRQASSAADAVRRARRLLATDRVPLRTHIVCAPRRCASVGGVQRGKKNRDQTVICCDVPADGESVVASDFVCRTSRLCRPRRMQRRIAACCRHRARRERGMRTGPWSTASCRGEGIEGQRGCAFDRRRMDNSLFSLRRFQTIGPHLPTCFNVACHSSYRRRTSAVLHKFQRNSPSRPLNNQTPSPSRARSAARASREAFAPSREILRLVFCLSTFFHLVPGSWYAYRGAAAPFASAQKPASGATITNSQWPVANLRPV